MSSSRKITVILPTALVRKAQKSTGEGLTPTIRRGLELVAAAGAYDELKKLRGRVRIPVDLGALREDR